MDKITNDARVYSDIQGLEQLRGKLKTDPKSVEKEVAKQFEGMLLQMVLRSMRDANKSFAPEESGNEMAYYQDMFDKQLTTVLSNTGLGLAESIERNIDAHDTKPPTTPVTSIVNQPHFSPLNGHEQKNTFLPTQHTFDALSQNQKNMLNRESNPQARPIIASGTTREAAKSFMSQHEFVKSLWHSAKEAAGALGVNPAVLVAQAALETDWGKKILIKANGTSSHNLFNIKADNAWNKATTSVATLEQKNGVLVKEKSIFRSYDTFNESFKDYAEFIKHNGRYAKAIDNASQPKQYVEALQAAGYATDDKYAHKIMDILVSPHFKNILAELK